MAAGSACNPWKLEAELLGLGLGSREVVAMVHEAMDPEMWIEIRAKGFRETENLSTGLFLLEMTEHGIL